MVIKNLNELFPPGLPDPAETDLDHLFDGASRFRLLAGGVGKGEPRGSQVLVERESPRDLAELRTLLRFSRTGFHCMCFGDLALEIHGPEGRRAVLGLHHGVSYRWDGVWKTDAMLADTEALARFFADRGDTSMRDQHERARHERERGDKQFAAWWAAAPQGVPPFRELCDEFGVMSATARTAVPAAIQARYPSTDAAVRVLLHWHGSGAGPWSGYPSYEEVPETLLRDYPLETVIRVLETSPLSPTETEGGARLLAGWGFWKNRARERSRVGAELRERLRARVVAAGNEDNLSRFDRAWRG
ncbi:MAG TPA: hypothetical protein VN903_36805 [Polyangia bacterium]|nr:hypothetical protein [Polyangia bacterium]